MSQLRSFLLGAAVGAGGLYGAMTFHVVQAEDGFHVVPKVASGLSDAYVDIREFQARDWNDHRGLSVAMIRANKEHLITESSVSGLRQAAEGALESLGLR